MHPNVLSILFFNQPHCLLILSSNQVFTLIFYFVTSLVPYLRAYASLPQRMMQFLQYHIWKTNCSSFCCHRLFPSRFYCVASKVSKFQNEFMKSDFLQKFETSIVRIFAISHLENQLQQLLLPLPLSFTLLLRRSKGQ